MGCFCLLEERCQVNEGSTPKLLSTFMVCILRWNKKVATAVLGGSALHCSWPPQRAAQGSAARPRHRARHCPGCCCYSCPCPETRYGGFQTHFYGLIYRCFVLSMFCLSCGYINIHFVSHPAPSSPFTPFI